MSLETYLQFLLALVFVVALIGGLAVLARRVGLGGLAPAGKQRRLAIVDVTRGGSPVATLMPEKRYYPVEGQPTSEAGIDMGFWMMTDARYANEAAYPSGPITRGGVTDKLLGDYANLFGDLSANSGNGRAVRR